MEHYIGIDNSSLDHKVRVIDGDGKLKLSITIENSLTGFNMLHNKIQKFSKPHIGFELPHGPLVDFLHDKNYSLYSLNPLKIKRYKESFKISGNKNDAIDAMAIAEYLKNYSIQTRKMMFNSSEIERLKTLSIIHSRLTNEHARYKNKLHFIVRQYFPLQEVLFSNFGCTVHLHMLIKFSTFKELCNASDDEITSFLKDHRYRNQKYINKVIIKIRNHSQMISSDVEYAYQFEAGCICRILIVLNEELKRIEKEMNQIVNIHDLGKVFRSLPGGSGLLACKLFAIFGDNKKRFSDSNGAQCYFGTAPKNYQSGLYHKVIMRKACNKTARSILYQYAFTSMQHSKWARYYYDEQRAKGKTNSVAIRALSNKWVKIIYKLWSDDIFYNEEIKLSPAA